MGKFLGAIAQPAGTPAGSFMLFDPGGASVCLRHLSITTDTAQLVRVQVRGRTIRSAYVGPGGWVWDWCEGLDLAELGQVGPLVVTTSVASLIEAQADGDVA